MATDVETEWKIMLEETARLDEVEIFEFLRVAKDFPAYFAPMRLKDLTP